MIMHCIYYCIVCGLSPSFLVDYVAENVYSFFIDTDLLVLVCINMFQWSIFWLQLGLGKLHTGADSHPAATEWLGEDILLLLCVHCCAQVLLLPGPPPNRTHQDSGHPGLQLSR